MSRSGKFNLFQQKLSLHVWCCLHYLKMMLTAKNNLECSFFACQF